MEAPNRFGVVSDEELLRIISEGTNGNTARATSTWLRVVSEYREEKGVGLSFATCTAEELAAFLERFYAEAKPKKHGEYSKSSYLAARAAIQRHLRIVKRPFNIFSDEPFAQANKVLDCVLKRHKKMGLEMQTKHKDPISGEDLAKVSAYFDDVLENPTPTKVTENRCSQARKKSSRQHHFRLALQAFHVTSIRKLKKKKKQKKPRRSSNQHPKEALSFQAV